MARILDSRNALDDTVRIFDDFYTFNLVVNGSEYDLVYSYFKSINDNTTIAQNFSVYLFRISQVTKVPVLDLLQNLRGLNKLDINKVMTYYLNSFKSKCSLYGVAQIPLANQAVARNIVV
jgi:hypothetical protein